LEPSSENFFLISLALYVVGFALALAVARRAGRREPARTVRLLAGIAVAPHLIVPLVAMGVTFVYDMRRLVGDEDVGAYHVVGDVLSDGASAVLVTVTGSALYTVAVLLAGLLVAAASGMTRTRS